MRELIRRLFIAALLIAPGARAGNQLEEKMAESVRAALHKAITDQSAPFLAFATVGEARAWLDAMSSKLERRMPDKALREDFLVTVHYEAKRAGLDPQLVLGLIQVESAFRKYAISSAGARGLMQVMPATAAWTARKLGIDFKPEQIADRQTNLRIGAGYLKLVLDDFQGAQALAAAAYNAWPARPRRWREGSRLDAAAWVENIPFNETRDYVKKVLSNATVYAHLLHGKPLSLKARLGATVGPRASNAPPPEGDLP